MGFNDFSDSKIFKILNIKCLMSKPRIHIALPVLDEYANLPLMINALGVQSVQDYQLYVCINQPESWWDDDLRLRICHDNQASISYLKSLNDGRINIIDKSSKGMGWQGKAYGIGWARKTLMDQISMNADADDLILSLDADTLFHASYLESVLENFLTNSSVSAFSIPYYHHLTGHEPLDRAMLRYEIYMRAYAVNLWRIGSPYCFTALGSAIALPIRAYRAIGGITPKHSGEDFYFLQKLVKYGRIVHWNRERVYPAARLSDRVEFGTGPALIKGIDGDWDSYPVYSMDLFRQVQQTVACIPSIYDNDVPTPLDHFLVNRLGGLPWEALRKNARTLQQFIRSCQEKIDGLRILQFLKTTHLLHPTRDEDALADLMRQLKNEGTVNFNLDILTNFDFLISQVSQLDSVRNLLDEAEMKFRKEDWEHGFSDCG